MQYAGCGPWSGLLAYFRELEGHSLGESNGLVGGKLGGYFGIAEVSDTHGQRAFHFQLLVVAAQPRKESYGLAPAVRVAFCLRREGLITGRTLQQPCQHCAEWPPG